MVARLHQVGLVGVFLKWKKKAFEKKNSGEKKGWKGGGFRFFGLKGQKVVLLVCFYMFSTTVSRNYISWHINLILLGNEAIFFLPRKLAPLVVHNSSSSNHRPVAKGTWTCVSTGCSMGMSTISSTWKWCWRSCWTTLGTWTTCS